MVPVPTVGTVIPTPKDTPVPPTATPTPTNPPPPPPPPPPGAAPTFGTQTVDHQIYHTGDGVNLVLPEANGGASPLTYSISPSLPSGLTLSGNVLSGTPSLATQTIEYTYKATDANNKEASLTFSITVFAVYLSTGSSNAAVWDKSNFTPFVTIPRGKDWQFQVVMPANTGIQFRRNDCVWPGYSPTDTTRLGSIWVQGSIHIPVIRCGLGAGGSFDLEVRVRYSPTGTSQSLTTVSRTFNKSWHVDDHLRTFYIDGQSNDKSVTTIVGVTSIHAQGLFPASRPSHLPQNLQPSPGLLTAVPYDEGAQWWTDAGAGITVERIFTTVGVDVWVRGYWEPGKKADKCGGTIACFMFGAANEHMLDGYTIWIEDPPFWPDEHGRSIVKQWADNWTQYNSKPDEYEYLPGVFAHEMGHTLGLGHGGGQIMSGYWQEGLGSRDEAAVTNLYLHHASH